MLCDQQCSQRKAAQRNGTADAVSPVAAEQDDTGCLSLVGSKAMSCHGCRIARNKLPVTQGKPSGAKDCCQAVCCSAVRGWSTAPTHNSLPSMVKTPGAANFWANQKTRVSVLMVWKERAIFLALTFIHLPQRGLVRIIPLPCNPLRINSIICKKNILSHYFC